MRGAPAKRLGSLLFVTGHYFSIGGTEGFIPTCAIAGNEYRDIVYLFNEIRNWFMFELQRSKSRIVALLLIVSLVLAACGSDASNPSPDETNSVPTTVSGGEPAENETDIDPSADGVEDSEKVPSSVPTTLGDTEASGATTSEAPVVENEASSSTATTTIATATTSVPVTTPDPSIPATTAPTSTFEIETVEPERDRWSTVSPSA